MARSTKSLFRLFTLLAVVLMLPMTAGAVLETFNAFTPLGQDVGNYPGWFDGTDNNGSQRDGRNRPRPLPCRHRPGPVDLHLDGARVQLERRGVHRRHLRDGLPVQWKRAVRRRPTRLDDHGYQQRLDQLLRGPVGQSTDGGIVTYWRNAAGDRVQTRIVALSGIKNNTWYRFTLEITKLAATQARLDVRLAELNATTGNPVPGGTVLTGTVPNSSTWAPPTGAAPAKYFTPTNMWPAYKNFNALSGAADNAFFEQSSCSGDFDKDGDVDGKDLPKIISGVEIFPLKTFAKQFGSSGCF